MIIIAPYAKTLRNGKDNPKNYPHWKEVIELIKEPIVQVGITGETQLVKDFRQNLSLPELTKLVAECRIWASVDSFFQHFCWSLAKRGVVIFSQSDPNIFGHPENINLLRSRNYLRANQFLWWEGAEYNLDAYVSPEEVYKALT